MRRSLWWLGPAVVIWVLIFGAYWIYRPKGAPKSDRARLDAKLFAARYGTRQDGKIYKETKFHLNDHRNVQEQAPETRKYGFRRLPTAENAAVWIKDAVSKPGTDVRSLGRIEEMDKLGEKIDGQLNPEEKYRTETTENKQITVLDAASEKVADKPGSSSNGGRITEKKPAAEYGDNARQHEKVLNQEDRKSNQEDRKLTAIKVKDLYFNSVPVRLYMPNIERPFADTKLLPALLHFHGGGWVRGSVDGYDSTNRMFTQKLGSTVIVSVGYRLAPKYPFPAALNDCETSFRYLATHARDFNIDANRIGLIGDSAGANLAAALSIKLRDINFSPQPKIQVLLYPPLQALDFNTTSYRRNAEERLSRSMMINYWLKYIQWNDTKYFEEMRQNRHASKAFRQYLYKTFFVPDFSGDGSKPGDYMGDGGVIWVELKKMLMNPYFAPLMAQDLTNLPRAFIISKDKDVLMVEDIWYAERLKKAGNSVVHKHFPGQHGSMRRLHEEEYRESRDTIIKFVQDNL